MASASRYLLECTLSYPTSDFTAPVDASKLDLPLVLEVPATWQDGSVKTGGAPVALAERTHAILRCLDAFPNSCVSSSVLSIAIDRGGGGHAARTVRTLR
jgi:hypothetical protein